MKTQIYLAALAICLLLNSCNPFGGKDLKKKEHYHLDIVVVDNPDVLMSDLDKIYAPVEDKENVKIVHIALSDKEDIYPSIITRIDIQNTPKVNVLFDAGTIGNFMIGLSPESTLDDLNFDIKESLKKLDLTSLNSAESVDENIKLEKIKEYIIDKKKTYKDIYIYSQNTSPNEFDKYVVYHNIDSVRQSISGKINQNKSSRILLVYNPPLSTSTIANTIKTDTVTSSDTMKINPVQQPIAIVSVTLPKTLSLQKGKTQTLTVKIIPEDATNKSITWESSDKSIAKVEEDGKVTAIKKGAVTITVKTVDSSVTATCMVNVTDKREDPCGSSGTISVPAGKYTGELKNCKPHGMGTIYYNIRILIDERDMKKRYAEAGWYAVGHFHEGKLRWVKVFDDHNKQQYFVQP